MFACLSASDSVSSSTEIRRTIEFRLSKEDTLLTAYCMSADPSGRTEHFTSFHLGFVHPLCCVSLVSTRKEAR